MHAQTLVPANLPFENPFNFLLHEQYFHADANEMDHDKICERNIICTRIAKNKNANQIEGLRSPHTPSSSILLPTQFSGIKKSS